MTIIVIGGVTAVLCGIIMAMNTVIDGETGEIVSDDEALEDALAETEGKTQKNWEETTFEGEPARFYPQTGAIMQRKENGRFVIVANRGGRPDFDGKAMVEMRELKKEEAIIRGLETAGANMGLRTSHEMLALIVAFRAKVAATSPDRTGNNDAKFIFSLVTSSLGEPEKQSALRIDMDKETAEKLIDALVSL